MSKNEEQDRGTSGEIEIKQGAKETLDISDSRLYYKVTSSNRKGCNISSVQPAIKDDTLCSYNRRNVSRGISKVVPGQCIEIT